MQQAIENNKNSANAEFEIEFMRLKDVQRIFGVSRASFDRWQNPKSEYYRPDFPKKIVMGGYVFYVKSEIRAYMQKLMDERK